MRRKHRYVDAVKSMADIENMTEAQILAYYNTPEGQDELSLYPHLSEYTVEEAVQVMMQSLSLNSVHRRKDKPPKKGGKK